MRTTTTTYLLFNKVYNKTCFIYYIIIKLLPGL